MRNEAVRVKIAHVRKKKQNRKGWQSLRWLRAGSWTPRLRRSLEQDSEETSGEETQQKME